MKPTVSSSLVRYLVAATLVFILTGLAPTMALAAGNHVNASDAAALSATANGREG